MHETRLGLALRELLERGAVKLVAEYEQGDKYDGKQKHYQDVLHIHAVEVAGYCLTHCRHGKVEGHDAVQHLEYLEMILLKELNIGHLKTFPLFPD